MTTYSEARSGRSRALGSTVPHIAAGHMSLGALSARAVSLRGDAHTFLGDPRQDCFGLLSSVDGRWLACGVADGLGSQALSGLGAETVLQAGLAALAHRLTEHGTAGTDQVVPVAAAVEAAMARAREVGAAPVSLSTTMTLAGLATARGTDGRHACVLVAVGDSPAVVLRRDGRWSYLTPDPPVDGPANVVSAHLPVAPGGVVGLCTRLGPGEVLVLASDGLSTPLGDGRNGLGPSLAGRWGRGPRDILPFVVDLTFDGHHDDRTAVAVWC